MEVEIRKSKRTINRRALLENLGKGALLAGFYGAGYGLSKGFDKEDETIQPAAVMIVLEDGKPLSKGQGIVINSVKFKHWCLLSKYEFRMYKADADLFQEEEWVKKMHKHGLDYGAPCLVVVEKDGSGRCYSIPNSLEDAYDLIKGGTDDLPK